MTYPPAAIEAVARALWAGDAHYGESWDDVDEPFKDFFRAQATALLDQIAPHYLTRIAALEALVKAADGLADALEAVRPKTHAAMCQQPEFPWSRCMCGCDQPALAAYRAAKEASHE